MTLVEQSEARVVNHTVGVALNDAARGEPVWVRLISGGSDVAARAGRRCRGGRFVGLSPWWRRWIP